MKSSYLVVAVLLMGMLPQTFIPLLAQEIDAVQAAPAAAAADWLQWRGPDRNGLLMGAKWPDRLQGHLNLQWEQALQPSYSGPLVNASQVITTETVDRKLERITAFDLKDGKQRWTREWEGSMAVPFFAASNGDWIRSTPAATSEKIVVAGMRDVVVCMNVNTGDELWRIDLPKQQGTPLQSFGCVCSPLIDENAVYLQSGGGLVKLNMDNGALLWRTLDSGGGMMNGGAFSSPIIATIAGKRQLVVATRDRLVGVELADGKQIWDEPIESFRGMNILTPVMVGERVFSSAHSGRSRLFEIGYLPDNQTGVEQVWENKAQGYMSSPIVIDGHLYMHLKNERAVCIDLKTGEERWTSTTFGKYWSMVGNVDGRTILALDSDGTLRLIAADPKELRIIDEMKVADDSWAHLAVRGSTVVVRALNAIRVYDWN
jgi:outer membrane protein assembly factor BamB